MTMTLPSKRETATTSRVAVHAIQTGLVRVRTNQVRGQGSGVRRLARTFVDRDWSEWLPIHAWLIDHPEGLIVVDTGETARTAETGYFPSWHPYYRRGVEFRVGPEDEIGSQLENQWVQPGQVSKVVMTHLHTDHAGGLHHFRDSEILVEQNALASASGWLGRLRGFLPNRWPEWFDPTAFSLDPQPFGPFERSMTLTEAGDVVVVPTPGHTASHVSVVVRTADRTYFLAGDTSYTQQLMIAGQVDGVSGNDDVARDTLRRIRRLAEQEPLVYLPSHDPESARRLEEGETVTLPGAEKA